MTINEAIKYYNNLADDIDKNPLPGDSSFEPRQLAEWLEELKAIKEGVVFYSNKPIEELVFEAKNNAIDECINTIDSWIERQKCFKDTLKYIATNFFEELEKLKEQNDGK